MFETPYNELWLATDEVAERIRTLDVFAPGSYSQLSKLSSIGEEAREPQRKKVGSQLAEGHEIPASTARDTLKALNPAGDDGSVHMINGRLKPDEMTGGSWVRC